MVSRTASASGNSKSVHAGWMDSRGRPAVVGEEVPDGHRTGLGVAVFDVEPGKVGRDLIIQAKRTGIPGAEHADRGEEFRVGSDAEDRVLLHRRLGVEGGIPVRLEQDDILIVDDPDHQSDPLVLDV